VSYLTPIRTGIESLMLGATGTTFAMQPERFKLCDAASVLDKCELSSGERRFEVIFNKGRPSRPINNCDGFALMDHPFTIRVAYLKTNAGGDNVEAFGEMDGAGTVDAIGDRAALDAMDITTVVSWYENWGFAGGPNVFDIQRVDGSDYNLVEGAQRIILEVPFLLSAQVTLAVGTYGA
jgi:hypothetical protein